MGASILGGFDVGNAVSLPALVAQTEFRPLVVETVVGLVVVINQAVFAPAPAILGSVRGISANYSLALAIVAAVQILAAVIVLAGRGRVSCSGSNG